ncbi:MAG: hypothetical protein J5809_01080 [Selenomonadaceae bacterium]|nr:hypothetical protein [Selenomonadaceae bacterium]
MEKSYETRIVNYALQTCGFYPLRAMQRWLIDTHFNKAKSTMMNAGGLAKLDDSIDLERLAKAATDLLNAYDIFRARLIFHPGTNDLCQRFDGEITPVTVEKISDEEFERRKKFLMEPYRLIDRPLYRFYLFETPTAKYIYIDFYHAIMDGSAITILFWRELDMRYRGKKITRQPLNYADFILDELKISPDELAEGNRFWREMLSDFDETRHLPPPDIKNLQAWHQEHIIVDIENIRSNHFANVDYMENVFFLAASMLTIAKTTDAPNIVMSWLHNGRNTAQERRLMGLMLEQFPISWDFEKDLSVEDFLSGLEAKIQTGMRYRRSLGKIYEEGLEDDCATFIFQKRALGALNEMIFDGKPAALIELPPNEISAAENSLDIELNLGDDDRYFIELDYDASRYSETAMKNFAATFDEMILALQDETRMISEIL